MNGNDQFFLQQNMKLLCRDNACSVYQMKNSTGDGTMTFYEVYPGIGVMYNDFHMGNCPPRKFENSTHTISIHHCREGRIEWEVSNGAYLYLASGDIMLDSSATENKHCSFPVSHYHGITITISVPDAIAGLSELLSIFSINLENLEQLFLLKNRPFIMHGDSIFNHVISELYQVPDSIRIEYLRVKILELLVALKTVDPSVLGWQGNTGTPTESGINSDKLLCITP